MAVVLVDSKVELLVGVMDASMAAHSADCSAENSVALMAVKMDVLLVVWTASNWVDGMAALTDAS